MVGYADFDEGVWGEGGKGAGVLGLVANVIGSVGVESGDARIDGL